MSWTNQCSQHPRRYDQGRSQSIRPEIINTAFQHLSPVLTSPSRFPVRAHRCLPLGRNFAKQDGRCSRSPLHASHIIYQCHHQPLVSVTDDKTAGSAETRSYFNDVDPLTLGETKRTILPRQIQNKSEADGPADTRGHSINRLPPLQFHSEIKNTRARAVSLSPSDIRPSGVSTSPLSVSLPRSVLP